MKLAAALALALGCSGPSQSTTAVPPPPMSTAHAWNVFDGDTLILELNDTPGPITSTAPRAPDAPPVTSAFMTATARDAMHEGALHQALERARTVDDFLALLAKDGYRIVPVR